MILKPDRSSILPGNLSKSVNKIYEYVFQVEKEEEGKDLYFEKFVSVLGKLYEQASLRTDESCSHWKKVVLRIAARRPKWFSSKEQLYYVYPSLLDIAILSSTLVTQNQKNKIGSFSFLQLKNNCYL